VTHRPSTDDEISGPPRWPQTRRTNHGRRLRAPPPPAHLPPGAASKSPVCRSSAVTPTAIGREIGRSSSAVGRPRGAIRREVYHRRSLHRRKTAPTEGSPDDVHRNFQSNASVAPLACGGERRARSVGDGNGGDVTTTRRHRYRRRPTVLGGRDPPLTEQPFLPAGGVGGPWRRQGTPQAKDRGRHQIYSSANSCGDDSAFSRKALHGTCFPLPTDGYDENDPPSAGEAVVVRGPPPPDARGLMRFSLTPDGPLSTARPHTASRRGARFYPTLRHGLAGRDRPSRLYPQQAFGAEDDA